LTLVLDATMALAWIFERAKAKEAERASAILRDIERQTALVPALFHIEVLNALVAAERRGVVTVSRALDFIARLDRLPIQTDPVSPPPKEPIFSLAREFQLTAYDATYLLLAIHSRAALATFDERLARARDKAGVAAP
jgi:predicted nucleic acid-binding protein